MAEHYHLEVRFEGTDSFMAVSSSGDECELSAEDLLDILKRMKKESEAHRREIKYLIVQGFLLTAQQSESGRHVQVSKPEMTGTRKLAPLATESAERLIITERDMALLLSSGSKVQLFPTQRDYERGLSFNVKAHLEN